MKLLDAGSYLICLNKKQPKILFKHACILDRSFGPIRGLIYGGADYAKHADNEMLNNDRDKNQ